MGSEGAVPGHMGTGTCSSVTVGREPEQNQGPQEVGAPTSLSTPAAFHHQREQPPVPGLSLHLCLRSVKAEGVVLPPVPGSLHLSGSQE